MYTYIYVFIYTRIYTYIYTPIYIVICINRTFRLYNVNVLRIYFKNSREETISSHYITVSKIKKFQWI